MDGKVIYTAMGMPRQRRNMLIKMAIWGLCTAILVFLLAQMKVNYSFNNLFEKQGYILRDDARRCVYVLGCIYFLFSIALLINLIRGNQSYINIDGCFCLFLRKRNFNLTYEQITNVQILEDGYLEITTFGKEYKCVLDGVYEACALIREHTTSYSYS